MFEFITRFTMFRHFLLIFSALFSLDASAKIVRVNECVVSIFGFCPFETIGVLLAVIALLLFAGFPLRWFIKKHFMKQFAINNSYEPDPILMFIYKKSGYIVIAILILIFLIIFNKP